MKKHFILLSVLLYSVVTQAQLTVEKIMQEPYKWIGTAPSNIFWSEDSKTIFFSWSPDKNKGDSLYKIVLPNKTPIKVTPKERRALPTQTGSYNRDNSLKIYEKQGELYLLYCKTLNTKQLTNTIERESNPYFSGDETKIIFS